MLVWMTAWLYTWLAVRRHSSNKSWICFGRSWMTGLLTSRLVTKGKPNHLPPQAYETMGFRN